MSLAIRTSYRATGTGRRLEVGDAPLDAPLCGSCRRDRAQVELAVELDSDVRVNARRRRLELDEVRTRRHYCVPCLESLVALGERAMGAPPEPDRG